MKVLNILVRRYLPLERFDAAVEFHERVIGQPARLRFDYPEYQLRLAQVASVLFIAGTAESLAPFTDVHMTLLVDDIQEFAKQLPSLGADVCTPRRRCPPDGTWSLGIPTGRSSSTSSTATNIPPIACSSFRRASDRRAPGALQKSACFEVDHPL